jgi:hypothetical protein
MSLSIFVFIPKILITIVSVSFVYDSNVLSFSLLFCFNFTCRSGIEQVSDADSDDNSVVETIPPTTDTIPPNGRKRV